MSNTFNDFRQVIENFKKVQRRFCKHGAADTEPDCEFARLVKNLVLNGETSVLDMKQIFWDVYDDHFPTTLALNRAWRKVFEFYTETPMLAREFADIREYVVSYFD